MISMTGTRLFSLEEKAIVVTGGAGHLGRVLCAGLRDFGANVLCASSKIVEFPDLAPNSYSGGSITSVVCDVFDRSAFTGAIVRFADTYCGIDGLVNNAARSPRGLDFNITDEQISDALGGIFSHYLTCILAAKPLFRDGRGSIVNNASIWGIVAPDPRTYLDLKNEPSLLIPPAKAAIIQLTKYLSVSLATEGIRVNALAPGWFPQKRGPDNAAYMEQVINRIPMGRIGTPDELVGAVIFLLSDASSYVTGQQIIVDGGYTAW